MTWTQFLILDGGYPDGVWRCAGCPARLGDNEVEGSAFVHASGCTEQAAAVRAATPEASGRRDDLARIAYDARAAWLLASGLLATPWDQLEPGTQEMFRREAGAVAAAERIRIREGLECLSSVAIGPDSVRVVPLGALLDLLEGP